MISEESIFSRLWKRELRSDHAGAVNVRMQVSKFIQAVADNNQMHKLFMQNVKCLMGVPSAS